MKPITFLIAGLLALAITGCTTMKIEDYADTEPQFRLEDYFLGQTRAWGIFEGRSGEVKRRFTVDIHGHMDDGELVLEEDFQYADGETDRRVWRITPEGDGRYTGRAGDIRGTARGEAAGHALNWRYTLELPWRDGTVAVQFDDWMFRVDDDVVVNRATVRKFGIRVGEVTLFFRKVGEAA